MKALYSIFILFIIALSLNSCDKALEEEPQNKLKPQTVEDYDELLNYGYPTTKDYGTIVPLDYYVEMMTDDMDLRYYDPDKDEYPMHPFSFENDQEDPSMMQGYDVAWKNLYQSIYYANVVVQNIDAAQGNANEKNYTKGEAMTLRAFSYFKLINLYGKPYDKSTAASDLGVPLKLDPTVQSNSYTRNSVQEIYDQIDQDLTEGIKLMSENDRRVQSKYKLRPISAELLASRVALYKKDYDKTIDYASQVIDQNSQIFDLSSNTIEYAQTSWGYGQGIHYLDPENENVLFVYGSNEFYRYVSYPGALGVSDDYLNLFESGDLRFYYFTYEQPLGRKYFKFRPFPNREGEPIRGFRAEEAFLNRAEAYAEMGQTDAALDDINYLRSFKFSSSFGDSDDYYKYTSQEYPSKTEVISAVKEERRRELFGEFHRWYDLRRYGMPQIEHHYLEDTFVLPEGDPRYIMQIPQKELDYNPDMKRNPR